MRNIAYPLLLLALAIACQPKQKPDTLTTIVQDAIITAVDGSVVDLDDYKGKVVMLDFWETWCTPCIRSFPGMEKAMQENPNDFVVIAISPGFMDTDEDMNAFIAENNYSFVWAKGIDLANALNIEGIPYKVFLDRAGNVHSVEMGSRGPEQDYQKLIELLASLPN
jgi:thiol-disulfide isomerase/thioredoxin